MPSPITDNMQLSLHLLIFLGFCITDAGVVQLFTSRTRYGCGHIYLISFHVSMDMTCYRVKQQFTHFRPRYCHFTPYILAAPPQISHCCLAWTRNFRQQTGRMYNRGDWEPRYFVGIPISITTPHIWPLQCIDFFTWFTHVGIANYADSDPACRTVLECDSVFLLLSGRGERDCKCCGMSKRNHINAWFCHNDLFNMDISCYPSLSRRCEVYLRYFTKSLRATVFMQTVYSTVVRGYSNWVCDKGVNLTNKERVWCMDVWLWR